MKNEKNIRTFVHDLRKKKNVCVHDIPTKELKHSFHCTMKKSILYILLYLYAFSTDAALPDLMVRSTSPKHEVRAVWLTTLQNLDWPAVKGTSSSAAEAQKKELSDMLDRLCAAGINTVLLQTRVRSTTIYPSSLEPWDACLTGTAGRAPAYDPLAYAVEECHKRGMELHAWVVTIPMGKWNTAGCALLRKKHPKLARKIGDEGYLNPEQSQTADYLADICEEITRNYDIDGIHLDYIRYPETWKLKVSREQGRRNITRIATSISRRVKALKPWVKMSCSPIGKHDDLSRYRSSGWNARSTVCQDAQAWLRDGIMDQLYPMMYFQGNHFFPFAIDWAEQAAGRSVIAGLGIYFLSPREKDWNLDVISREMAVVRSLGMGHAYFRTRFFLDNVKGVRSFAEDCFDASPALTPPMTWASSEQPAPPTDIRYDLSTHTLSWKPADAALSSPSLLYNIYASTQWPVDTDNPANLVKMRCRECSVMAPILSGGTEESSTPVFYAVTAINRYGIESQPVQAYQPTDNRQRPTAYGQQSADHILPPAAPGHQAPVTFLPNDGATLTFPHFDSSMDIPMVAIVTMQGKIVKSAPYQAGRALNIATLPEGIYQLRSLNRRGNSHLLGYFIINPRIN